MKKITFFLVSVFLMINLNAQDTLYLTNTTKVIVNVLSLEDETIKYTEYDADSETEFNIPVARVDMIIYADGNVLDFTENEMNSSFLSTQQTVSNETNKKDERDFKTKLGLGIMIGATFNTIHYEFNEEALDLYNSFRFGPAGGIFLEWEMARFLSLRTSFYYLDKGDRTDGESYISRWVFPNDPEVSAAEGNGYLDKHLGYIEGSIMPLLNLSKKDNSFQFQIGAGVFAAYGVAGNENVDLYIKYYLDGKFVEDETRTRTNDLVFVKEGEPVDKKPHNLYYNQIDYGLAFYIGIKPKPFNLGATISWGSSNILTTDTETVPQTPDAIDSASNFGFSLMFGVYF